jgi:hypothetical protein
LIVPKDWKSFNSVMEGVKTFKVQVIREITTTVPQTGYLYPIPGNPIIQTRLKYD